MIMVIHRGCDTPPPTHTYICIRVFHSIAYTAGRNAWVHAIMYVKTSG